MIMKVRITSFSSAVIATSIILLILTANPDSAAAWSPEANRAADLVARSANNVTAQTDLLGPLTAGSIVPGLYDLSFREWRSGVLEPVSSLPVLGGPVVLFAHVEDTNGNPAEGGTVTFEYCGNYEPKETCDAGLARWNRLGRISIGSCYCKSCGGLPGYDPGPGNACLFVTGTGNIPGDDGFRFKYAGRRGGVDSGMSGAANFTWTTAP